jgi:hypothetical protein
MFKLPRYRVFNHIPIYYDPVKERQKEREQRILREHGHITYDHSLSGFEHRIRGKMRKPRASMFETYREEKVKSNIRLIIIIAILAAMAIYLIHSSSEWFELVKH